VGLTFSESEWMLDLIGALLRQQLIVPQRQEKHPALA
jgi:hypothetical protein